MAFKEMREFLALLRHKGQLKDLDVRLNCEYGTNELQALMRYLAETEGPGVILKNLEGYNTPDIPVVFNPFGTRERTAMMIGETDYLQAKAKLPRVLEDRASWIEPVLVERAQAPCKENLIPQDRIALDKQLPHVWIGKEGPSYINGGVVVSKDPETGKRNAGRYRLTQFWKSRHPSGGSYSDERQTKQLAIFALWDPPMNHVGLHLHKASQMGKPLELAVAVMCEPAVHVAAATGVPFGLDEYAYAGGLRGQAVELVKCETVDLEVPATAEFVIEGVISPDVPTETIGWLSGSMGYYDKIRVLPVLDVTCITHRDDPLWYATVEMMPPFDHNYLALLGVEGELLSDLQRKIPEVQDVVVTPNMTYIVQLSVDGDAKPHPEFGKYVLHAVWGASGRWGRTAKLVVVVGPDVNPYDLQSVEWAVATRVQPHSDTIVNRSGQAFLMDPSAPKGPQAFPASSEQMGIDATIKVPERFQQYAKVSQADPAAVAAIAEKLRGIL